METANAALNNTFYSIKQNYLANEIDAIQLQNTVSASFYCLSNTSFSFLILFNKFISTLKILKNVDFDYFV